jgi:probable phosphomutase (TIGR03848 family)
VATVLLLRHGRTTANADGGLAGRRPVELDDTGRGQAATVGARLAGLPLSAVVSSPLIRCRQTLELAVPQVTPIVEDRLTECGYGQWEGQPLKTLAKDPLWRVVQQHPSAVVFPGGEAMAAMSTRAVAAVRDWDARVTAEQGPEAIWLACSHGDVIKAIIADALGMHLDQFQRVVVDPASVTAIRYTPLRPFVLRLNDTAGALAALVPPKRRRRSSRVRAADSDAPVGGGSPQAPATADRDGSAGLPRAAGGGPAGPSVDGASEAAGGPARPADGEPARFAARAEAG